MTGGPAALADVILIVHFGIAAFITLGLPVVWIGAAAGWRFVRNPWFRWIHAGLMGFVLAETVAGKLCPLTVWEAALRRAAGEDSDEPTSFVGYWVGRVLFPDFDPAWFGVAYGLFLALIVLTMFLVPVRRPAKPADSIKTRTDNRKD
jgi:signal transduction histidine kinase